MNKLISSIWENIGIIVVLIICVLLAVGMASVVNDVYKKIVYLEGELDWYQDNYQSFQGSMLFEIDKNGDSVYEQYRMFTPNAEKNWYLINDDRSLVTSPTPRQEKILARALAFHEMSKAVRER